MRSLYLIALFLVIVGCSPLRTSIHDEKYQWELTLHEVQTNLDDLRHDTNCFGAEIQIIDGRLKSFETALSLMKQQDIERQQAKIDQVAHQLASLERKWSAFEKKQDVSREGIENLSSHAKETNVALSQFKNRIEELETEILLQNRRLEALSKLKGNIENLAKTFGQKTYKVKPGDSLERIAKAHKTDVAALKQINQLQQDLIVIDQELKLP